MKIDKVFTEKERYQMLREAGYSSTEARKFRRYGGDKFINVLEEKKPRTYANAYNEIKQYEAKEKTTILKPDPIPFETQTKYNYNSKYNYVVQVISKNKVDYITYTTNKKLNANEIQNEIAEYVKSANRRYRRKIKNWRLKEIQVK